MIKRPPDRVNAQLYTHLLKSFPPFFRRRASHRRANGGRREGPLPGEGAVCIPRRSFIIPSSPSVRNVKFFKKAIERVFFVRYNKNVSSFVEDDCHGRSDF
jgi:hypothetical protein